MRVLGTAAALLAVMSIAAIVAQEPERGVPPVVPAKRKLDKRLYTAADATQAMAVDAVLLSQTVMAEEMYNIRYLSIHNISEDMRAEYASEVSLAINRLSRNPNIFVPARVGPGGIVLRVNLADYGIDPAVWDKMADIHPYFYEKFIETDLRVTEVENVKKTAYTETIEVHKTNEKGEKLYYGGDERKPVMEKKQVTKYKTEASTTTTAKEAAPGRTKVGTASWLDPEAMAVTIKLVQARTPIVRADWFLANAMLPPLYYDFLGLKTLDDAKELALFDKRAEKQSDIRATVVLSGSLARKVARNNRILKRVKTANGAWWETFDFKTSVGEQNIINNFLTTNRDGGEIIFSLPNGLHGYFLVDNKDARVDEVPIEVAVDSLAQDTRVRCGRSCIWCHSKGIQPFRSDFKLEVNQQNLVDLGIVVKSDTKKTIELIRFVRQTFDTVDFENIVKNDNIQYENAVKAATGGRTAPATAATFLRLYDEYAEVPLDAEALVYESGFSDTDVQAAIKLKLNGVSNGVLLRRVFKMPLPIRRDQFEESFADYMHRVMAWQAAKRLIGPPVPAKEGPQP